MSNAGVYLTEETWERVRLTIDSLPLSHSSTEGSGEGNGQCLHWISVSGDITPTSGPYAHQRQYQGVASLYDSEQHVWVDQTGVVKVVHNTGGILYPGRYLCTAAGSHGTISSPSTMMTDNDYGTDASGHDVYDVWVVVNPPKILGQITHQGIDSTGDICYSWSLLVPGTGGFDTFTTAGAVGGLGGQPLFTTANPGSGTAAAVYTLNFSTSTSTTSTPTGGTISFTLSGIAYGPFNWNASSTTLASDINTALSPTYTATDTGGSYPINIIAASVGVETSPATITNALIPSPAQPLYDINGTAVDLSLVPFPGTYNTVVFEGNPVDPSVTISQTQATDGLTTSDIWTVTPANMAPGSTYTIFVDGTESSPIDSMATGSAFSSAIGAGPTVTFASPTYTITYSDLIPHTIALGNMALVGTLRTWLFDYGPVPVPVTVVTGVACVSGIIVVTTSTIKAVA